MHFCSIKYQYYHNVSILGSIIKYHFLDFCVGTINYNDTGLGFQIFCKISKEHAFKLRAVGGRHQDTSGANSPFFKHINKLNLTRHSVHVLPYFILSYFL